MSSPKFAAHYKLFVFFQSADSVEAALKLDGKLVLNRELRVMSNNSRAVSLSNLITVKRKKIHKKRKPLPKDEACTDTVVKKLKKFQKTSHKSYVDTEAQIELLTSRETDLIMKKKVRNYA